MIRYQTSLDEAEVEKLYDAYGGTPSPTPYNGVSSIVERYPLEKIESGASPQETGGRSHASTGGGGSGLKVIGGSITEGLEGSGAFSLDGVDDYLEFWSSNYYYSVPDSTGTTMASYYYLLGNNPRAICLWAQIDDTPGTDSIRGSPLFNMGMEKEAMDFGLWWTADTTLRIQFTGAASVDVSIPEMDHEWHHYCLSYDGSNYQFYFDAEQRSEGTVTLDTGCECDWMNPLRIGYRSQNADLGIPAYLKGVVDDAVLLDAALTEQQALKIYLDYLGTTWPTTALKPTPRPTFAPVSSYSWRGRFDRLTSCRGARPS